MASLIATTINEKMEAMVTTPSKQEPEIHPAYLTWEAIGGIVGVLIPIVAICVFFGKIQSDLGFLKESLVESKNREREKEEKHNRAIASLTEEIRSTEKSLLGKFEEHREMTETNQKERREEFKEYLVMRLKEVLLPLHREIDQLKILHQRRDETLNDLKRKVKELE